MFLAVLLRGFLHTRLIQCVLGSVPCPADEGQKHCSPEPSENPPASPRWRCSSEKLNAMKSGRDLLRRNCDAELNERCKPGREELPRIRKG